MAKSEKNIVRDILKAQGVYVHGDIPEPTPEAMKILRDYGSEYYNGGYDDGVQDANSDWP